MLYLFNVPNFFFFGGGDEDLQVLYYVCLIEVISYCFKVERTQHNGLITD